MRKMGSLVPKEIVCRATGGAQIDDCKREAISLAAEEGVDVVFEHNNHDYHVSIKDLLSMMQDKTICHLS